MTDAIGMIEALSEWGEHLNPLEAAAKEDGIGPGDYLGDYHAGRHAGAARAGSRRAGSRGGNARDVPEARVLPRTREPSRRASSWNKIEEATPEDAAEAHRQKLTLEGASRKVIRARWPRRSARRWATRA